jgi:hypothetical protein
MEHSNEDEEVNPPEELHHTTLTTSIEATLSPARHMVSMHPTQRAFGATAPTSNCSTMPGKPPTPPSETAVPTYHHSSLSCNTARSSHPQPQAAQRKLLVDHDRRTNIRGRRPGLEVKLPPLRLCQSSRQPRRTRDTRRSPKPYKHLLHPMKHLPVLDLNAAASTHIHYSRPLPRHPPTTREDTHNCQKPTLQGDAHKRETKDIVVARSG